MKREQGHPLTRPERRHIGRLCRDKLKRVDQGRWDPKLRKFDAIELLLAHQHGRIPKLLRIKWAKMAASPFSFFRGSVPLMAADLALLPTTGLTAQLCGDAHVQNLGAFEAPDGRLIFDINDFDETLVGPWEWDVKRMAASLVLAGREAGDSAKGCKQAVLEFAASYRAAMNVFAEMPWVDLARYQIFRSVSPVRSVLSKAQRATPIHNLQKLTEHRHEKHLFRDAPPLQFHVSAKERAACLGALREYSHSLLPERAHFFSQYTLEDLVFRVTGTGSVGLRDYALLLFGGAAYDPLFLQIKEEPGSAYAQHQPKPAAAHQGQRVAEGARAMQMQSDVFLGWTTMDGRYYIVRQLRDHKAGIEDADLKGKGLLQYAQLSGELLAKGHARTGDPCAIEGYVGASDRFDRAIASFAIAYANQTDKDWKELKHAIRIGKVRAAKLSASTKEEGK